MEATLYIYTINVLYYFRNASRMTINETILILPNRQTYLRELFAHYMPAKSGGQQA